MARAAAFEPIPIPCLRMVFASSSRPRCRSSTRLTFEKYDRITLPATTNTKKLKQALDAKFAEAKKVAPQYDDVMRFKRPDWTLAAFYRKAYLLERLAQTIYEAPPPPEYKRKGQEEFLAAYQDGLAQFAQPFEDQAVNVYVQAIEAARKLHVKNEWTKRIGESLSRFRPKEYPVLKEPRARFLADDLAPVSWADSPVGPKRHVEEPPPEAAPVAAPAEAAAPAGAASPGTTAAEATVAGEKPAADASPAPSEAPAPAAAEPAKAGTKAKAKGAAAPAGKTAKPRAKAKAKAKPAAKGP